jgi:hypothetical protein
MSFTNFLNFFIFDLSHLKIFIYVENIFSNNLFLFVIMLNNLFLFYKIKRTILFL